MYDKANLRPELEAALEYVAVNPGDFALYCRACEWIGERNTAHARSGVRIWSKR